MKPNAAGVLAGCLAFASEAGAAGGKVIFHSDFEGDCTWDDADLDRLPACVESGLKLDPASADTDGDGLNDGDEVLGTTSGLDLPAMGVDPRRKNILVEYDWFEEGNESPGIGTCAAATHSHAPTPGALQIVTVAFGAAPVDNPDGTQGIDIIHDVGQGGALSGGGRVPEGDGVLQGSASGLEFFDYYNQEFALNRKGYFHYVMLPHRFVDMWGKDDYSGSALVSDGYRRDRIIVSLICNHTDQRAGHTILHELGHNLGLRHGGDENCNYKPNYNSVMNYKFQFPGVDLDCDRYGDGVADFSRGLRPPLNENAIDERKGVCGSTPIDFTMQNGIEAAVTANLNKYDKELADCGAELGVLKDHDDWRAIEIGVDSTIGENQGKPEPEAAVCGSQ